MLIGQNCSAFARGDGEKITVQKSYPQILKMGCHVRDANKHFVCYFKSVIITKFGSMLISVKTKKLICPQ